MIPSDIRLYTWLDVEDTLIRAVNVSAPSWLIDARCYWDTITVRVAEGKVYEAKQWLRDIFEPRIAASEHDLFSPLALSLESASGQVRTIPIVIEESAEKPKIAVIHPSFTRSPIVVPKHEFIQPKSLSEGSPTVFAFHSFKGGVGRTVHALALSQVLVEGGKKVLLVDADLEAPGISWLLEKRLPAPPISFSDFLALVHGDEDIEAKQSIKLVAARLQDSYINGMYVLPAFRTVRMFHSLDIRPEHLLQSRKDPYALLSLLGDLGRELNVDAVIIDLRAGLSELSAGLLLDPRAQRVLVTSLAGQSTKGTELVLELMAEKAASSSDGQPVPIVILNQAPPDLKGSDVLESIEERFFKLISKTVTNNEIDPSDALRGPSWFDSALLTLPSSWDDALTLIKKSSASDTVRSMLQLLPSTNETEPYKFTDQNLNFYRQKLSDTAKKLIFAEQGEGEDFLPISPLRNLSADHRSQLPVSVIVGAKGAGKTFTYLQVLRRKTWQSFVSATNTDPSSVDATILPVLEPAEISGSALSLIKSAKVAAVASLDLGETLESYEVLDVVRGWLKQELHEGQWRDNWLDLIAWCSGYKPREKGVGKNFSSHLASNGKNVLALFDGLEDLFQNVTSDTMQQIALRSLLQDVPNWLEQQPNRTIGLLVFVRRDMVSAAVLQNSGQLLARYEPYALKWDKVEALRLVVWIIRQASLTDEQPSVDEIRDMEETRLTENLIFLWGKKLGNNKSREGRSAEWVLAALSDFRGQVQARDVVRLLHLAAAKSLHNEQWKDRILVPNAVKEAVDDCSRHKIDEISQENKDLAEIFKKLKGLNYDKKVLPFNREDIHLTPPELLLLELNGIAVEVSGQYYMAEIFRRGLDFRFPAGARPKILAISRRHSSAASS